MKNPPLAPETVEGTDPGSVYAVVARSGDGYIAIRRISKYFYRIRAERFDGAPLLNVEDSVMIASVVNAGMAIKNGGSRITGASRNKYELCQYVALLQAVLFQRELAMLDLLPEGNDPGALEQDKKIEAAYLKQALIETGAAANGDKASIKN